MIDVDHFKAFNDSFVHQSGDDALQRIAAVVDGFAKRPLDVAARYGGEELTVVLFDVSLEHLALLAEQLRAAVQGLRLFPALARQAKRDSAQILFWDESGFRADTVHGKTWGLRGQTPIVYRPGQRQSISAASAVGPRGEFWFCTYAGGLNGELFVQLLRQLMHRRRKAKADELDCLSSTCFRARPPISPCETIMSSRIDYRTAPALIRAFVECPNCGRIPKQSGELLVWLGTESPDQVHCHFRSAASDVGRTRRCFILSGKSFRATDSAIELPDRSGTEAGTQAGAARARLTWRHRDTRDKPSELGRIRHIVLIPLFRPFTRRRREGRSSRLNGRLATLKSIRL